MGQMSAEQIALVAAGLRELGLPDFANRWIGMTPERLAEHEAAIAEIAARQAGRFDVGSDELLPRVNLFDRKKERTVTRELGSKERQLRAQREGKVSAPKAERPAATAPAKPQAGKAEDREKTVPRTKKKGGAPAAKAKAPSAKKGDVDHSPRAVGEFICRKGGCTMAELVAKFGVEAHPMRAKIHDAKHKLGFAIEYDHAAKRYGGQPPKEKAA